MNTQKENYMNTILKPRLEMLGFETTSQGTLAHKDITNTADAANTLKNELHPILINAHEMGKLYIKVTASHIDDDMRRVIVDMG